MNRTKAQRLRFGILAARHQLERSRLTDWQTDYLEACEASGWRIKDSTRAYDHEWRSAYGRFLAAERQAAMEGRIAEFWKEHYGPRQRQRELGAAD